MAPRRSAALRKLVISCVDDLKLEINKVFQEVQSSLSGHRKLVVVLSNIFHTSILLNYLEHFALQVCKCLNRSLALKKGEQIADRIAKFTSLFVATLFANEDTNSSLSSQDDDSPPTEMFVRYLILHLLRGIESKNRHVRYRVVQLLAYLVNHLGEIDHQTFEILFMSLQRRLFDREPYIRLQAVVSISRFQSFDFTFPEGENPFTIDLSKRTIRGLLVSAMRGDPSHEVRRAAMLNLNKTRYTLPLLIERARDVNGINRRLVYSRITRELGDFKTLDFNLREHLLKWGLDDRDNNVRNAAMNMLCDSWMESVGQNIEELVDKLNVTESAVASKTLMELFHKRPEILESLVFDELHWKLLSVDQAFLLRVVYEYCNKNRLYELIDKNFPEPIDLGITLEKYFAVRLRMMREAPSTLNLVSDHKCKMESLCSQEFVAENEWLRRKAEADLHHKSINEKNSDQVASRRMLDCIQRQLQSLELSDDDSGDDYTLNSNKSKAESGFDDSEILKHISDLSESELRQKQHELSSIIANLTTEIDREERLEFDATGECRQLSAKLEALAIEKAECQNQFANMGEEHRTIVGDLKELEFIIDQIVLIAKDFDFSDEIGRRKMSQTIRHALADEDLPDHLMESALKVLHQISINEKDFVAMSTEIITDIRDAHELEEDTFHSAVSGFLDDPDRIANLSQDRNDSQDMSLDASQDIDVAGSDGMMDIDEADRSKRAKKRRTQPKMPPDETIIRCLTLTKYVLELIDGPLENYLALESIYTGLVNYALKCTEKRALHLLGLRCLGLFAIIDKRISREAIVTLYLSMRIAGEQVRIIGLRAVMDILSTYGIEILTDREFYQFGKLFFKALNEQEMPALQCVVAEGLSKLFLAEILSVVPRAALENKDQSEFETENQLLEALILAYFDPRNDSNEELRQILAFCLPAFAFSHPKHQLSLAAVSGECIYRLFDAASNFVGITLAISPTTIVQQLIHWCDPKNIAHATEADAASQAPHLWQCVYFLEVLEQDSPKNIKKAVISNLQRLHLTAEMDLKLLKGLVDGITETRQAFAESSENPEFVLDKPTAKSFEAFHDYVKGVYTSACEREALLNSEDSPMPLVQEIGSSVDNDVEQEVTQSNHEELGSRTLDISNQNEVAPDEELDLEKDFDESPGDNDDGGSGDSDDEEQDQSDTSASQKPAAQVAQVDKDLEDIDRMLEEEDGVEYSIDE